MKAMEIESWALRILERVETHLPVEDSRVELKTEWIDPVKAARRLAGHANAARGENILWIIGADEKQGLVTGANYQDLATWFPQVKACFESTVPHLHDLNVTFKGKTVAAMCFDTSRFPFVVKNPKGGEIQYEVPWREGTSVRTATRSDLVSMLLPLSRTPKVEILDGEVHYIMPQTPLTKPYIRFTLKIYIVPLDSVPVTLPFHKCSATVEAGSGIVTDDMEITMDTPAGKAEKNARHMRRMAAMAGKERFVQIDTKPRSEIIEVTTDEIVIRGAGKIEIDGRSDIESLGDWDEMRLIITLVDALTESQLPLKAKFSRTRGTYVWTL